MKEIKLSIESNISLFIEVVKKSNSYVDLCRYYDLPNNGKQREYFRCIIDKNNISTICWDSHKKFRKYEIVEKECPICKNKFTAQSGHKREKTTCSYKCSNIYFSNKRHTVESDKKISDSIKKYHLSIGLKPIRKIKCVVCGKEKISNSRTQKCCSNKCAANLKSKDPVYIANLKAGVRKAVKEGRHQGWKSRNILSYPEKFFMKVLDNNTIKFESNKPFMGYFLDFAIGDKMIDLEIDGKQYKYPERIENDIKRDKILTDNGWKVYRIEWNSINTDVGKIMMKEKIDNFIKFYNK